jgi:micrococcal nuclease
MKRYVFVSVLILLSALIFTNHYNVVGYYSVTEVFDGDTIAVNMAGRIEKIRLIGVDTPETKDPRKPVQCYGPEASMYSHNKLDGAKVRLVADTISTNRDRYDRLLRYVYLDDGTFYNQELLRTGNARAYLGFPFSKSQVFSATESGSKQAKSGLWAQCGDVI